MGGYYRRGAAIVRWPPLCSLLLCLSVGEWVAQFGRMSGLCMFKGCRQLSFLSLREAGHHGGMARTGTTNLGFGATNQHKALSLERGRNAHTQAQKFSCAQQGAHCLRVQAWPFSTLSLQVFSSSQQTPRDVSPPSPSSPKLGGLRTATTPTPTHPWPLSVYTHCTHVHGTLKGRASPPFFSASAPPASSLT